MKKITNFTWSVLLFPIALVLFEYCVYTANDMIQPAMISIVREMDASMSWVSTSMTAFMLGGVFLQWLFGPLSDRYGRRPVLLGGVLFFSVTCLLIIFTTDIHSFIAFRFLQGMGLSFIGSVGYAVVQEIFEEKAAIRLIALMANVALISPLLGPLFGAWIMSHSTWHMTFILVTIGSLISFVALCKSMPETIVKLKKTEDKKNNFLKQMFKNYWLVFSNRNFLKPTMALPLLNSPMLAWIALSPVILMEGLNYSMTQYALFQIPVFAGLIGGNVFLAIKIKTWSITKSIKLAAIPLVAGLILMNLLKFSSIYQAYFLAFGVGIVAFGQGISSAVLTRIALTSSEVASGTVSSAMYMMFIFFLAVGIEIFSLVYEQFGIASFGWLSVIVLLAYWPLSAGACKIRKE